MSAKIFNFEEERTKRRPIPLDNYEVDELEIEEAIMLIDAAINHLLNDNPE